MESKNIKPISPKELSQTKELHPDIVSIFNEILTERFSEGKIVTIFQEEVIERFLSRNEGFEKSLLFTNHMLDIEPFYRKEGWKVSFDRPGYSESYKAFWEFGENKSK